MSKHILKLFSPSGTRTILVFLHQTLRQNSDGNPLTLNVGVKCSLHCRPVLQDGWVGARCPLSNTTPHLGPLGLAGLPTFAFLPPPCHCNFVNFNSILKYYFHQPTQSTKSIGPYKIDFLKPFITKQCSQARPSTGCLAARLGRDALSPSFHTGTCRTPPRSHASHPSGMQIAQHRSFPKHHSGISHT